MTTDERFMQQALDLALLGGRAVAPNPMVGAVIVKNGKVIGRGHHQYFGGPHAEIETIASVKKKSEVDGATMYVTLEPCRHFGKTPPCWDFVEAMGIKRLVCGSRDPFQKKGRKSTVMDVEFLGGPVAEECRRLNKFFYMWTTHKRPFVTAKIAVSADGFVAGEHGHPVHFTSANQDLTVHRLRAEHQAIMVGINTVLNDNPRLTVRHVKGENPLRIILDSKGRTPKNANVLTDGNYLIATCKKGGWAGQNVWISPTKKRVSLKKLLRHLASIGISSVLVEPGPTLYRSLKKQGLIDELIVLRGKKKIGKGLRSPF